MMSRYHCRVVWNGETLSADDNDSTHGILVNDQLVASQVLKQGDVLICGVTAFTVQLETGERIESPTAAG